MITWCGERQGSQEFKDFEKELREAVKPPEDARPKTSHDLRGDGMRTWEYWAVFTNGDLNKDDVVLEFGAYPTFVGVYLAGKVKKIVVSDTFEWGDERLCGTCYTAEEWPEEVAKYGVDNLEMATVNITRTSYPDKTFDKIISHGVYEHILDDAKGLREICRILKDDGLVSMTIDYKWGDAIPYGIDLIPCIFRGRVYNGDALHDLVNASPFEFVEDPVTRIEAEKGADENNEDSIFAFALLLRKRQGLKEEDYR